MVYRQKRARISLYIIAAVIATALGASAFIEIPFRIKTYAEVFPKEKWLLTRGGSGELVSNVIDFTQGHTAQYNILQFERGEFISANFSKFLNNLKKEFSEGDTVVYVRSSDVQDQLVSAEGELEIAMANLKAQTSAQKAPLVSEAETRLKYNEERLGEQKILYERAKQLFEKGFSSQQEFEQIKWNYDLLVIENKIYNAQLENLKTGVKPEEIRYLESQISSIKSKLNFLKERETQLLLTSPIAGRIISSFSPDTLLNVANTKQVVLHIPVRLAELPEFKEGRKLSISFTGFETSYKGQVISIGREVRMLEGQQVIFLSVLIDNSPEQLMPGMILESRIEIKNIRLLDHIINLLTS